MERITDEMVTEDREAYWAIVLQAHRRSMIAQLRHVLELMLDDEFPLLGIEITGISQNGAVTFNYGGGLRTHEIVGAMEFNKQRLLNIQCQRMPDSLFAPWARAHANPEAEMGDQPVVDDDGEPDIWCKGRDKVEADREVKENALLLVAAFAKACHTFYGNDLSGDINTVLRNLEQHAAAAAEAVASENFYAGTSS